MSAKFARRRIRIGVHQRPLDGLQLLGGGLLGIVGIDDVEAVEHQSAG